MVLPGFSKDPTTETVDLRVIALTKRLNKNKQCLNPSSTWIVGESAIDRLMKESFGATTAL